MSSATSEVLQRLAGGAVPVLSLFGGSRGVPIAASGVMKTPALIELVRRLVTLGHRRIVLLSHRRRVEPTPARFERISLGALADQGIETSRYHLPVWEPTADRLRQFLDRLFKHTPPTALILEDAHLLIAIQQHLAGMGKVVPRKVFIACCEPNLGLYWCDQAIPHMRWSLDKLVNRVVRWSRNVAMGKEDLRQVKVSAELVGVADIPPPLND